MTSKRQNRHTDAMHESRLTLSPCKTFPIPGRVHENSGRVCKKELSSLRSNCAVLFLMSVLGVCVTDVGTDVDNSIVLVPDQCFFQYLTGVWMKRALMIVQLAVIDFVIRLYAAQLHNTNVKGITCQE